VKYFTFLDCKSLTDICITDFVELFELCQGEICRLILFDDKVIVLFVDFEKRRSLLLLNVE